MPNLIEKLLSLLRSGAGNKGSGEKNFRGQVDRRTPRNIKKTLDERPEAIQTGSLNRIAVGPHLEDNIQAVEALSRPSPDLVIRRIEVFDGTKAAIVFFDTLGRSDLVSTEVIRPLTYEARFNVQGSRRTSYTVEDVVRERVINTAEIELTTAFGDLMDGIAEGKAAILFDGSTKAILVNLAGFDQRPVEEPITEAVVRGPREGFSENLHTNLSLIRRRIASPLLRFETLKIGRWTKTKVVVAYIRGIASEQLVDEVLRRLNDIEIDGVIDTSYLEEFIEDTPYTVFPQVLATERPDSVTADLLEGRVAILCNGSPFALVVPTTLWSLMNASEDHYQRWDGATFIRLLRYGLVSLVVLLPSFYVAATTFHPEMLPANMLVSIAAAREAVPFSSFVEVFAMELTFEALREAGVRLPRPVGQTIGIVGAIVIGEAAVQAQLVSAPVVIIVAFTGVSSFVVPHFNLGIAIRLLRFPILILAGSFGLFGIAVGMLLLVLHLTTLRSFGLPYLSPISPFRPGEIKDSLTRLPLWRMFTRPRMPGAEPTWREGFPIVPRPYQDDTEASSDAPKRR